MDGGGGGGREPEYFALGDLEIGGRMGDLRYHDQRANVVVGVGSRVLWGIESKCLP